MPTPNFVFFFLTPLCLQLMRFQNYDLGGASRAVSLAIEQTQVNIQWVKENKDDVLRWFEQKTSSVRQMEY